MKTLSRNADNDLYLSLGGLATVEGAEAQCQIIESIILTQRGELQFDENGGIDYFGTIFQNASYIDYWAGQVQTAIENLPFVSRVEDFTYEFDRPNSTLNWSMTVINTDDERLDLQNRRTVLDGSPGVSVDWNDIYGKPTGLDEAINMVAGMSDRALEVIDLIPSAKLPAVRETINQVVYGDRDEDYVADQTITFVFEGVPLGISIDFSNLSIGLKNFGTIEEPIYHPLRLEISDGTSLKYLSKMDGSPLSADGNQIWFIDSDNGVTTATQKHTLKTSGTVTIKIRGGITSLSTCGKTGEDSSPLPIFLRSNSPVPFPYLYSISIGNNVPLSAIGDNAFRGFTNLRTISWPIGAGDVSSTTLGEESFALCSGLLGIEWLPPNVTSLGEGCFLGCSSLTSIRGVEAATLLTTLPAKCFKDCTNLVSIVYNDGIDKRRLPLGIATIGDECFSGCDKINFISTLRVVNTTAPFEILHLSSTAFDYDVIKENEGFAVYVPAPARTTYANDAQWSRFGTDKILANN